MKKRKIIYLILLFLFLISALFLLRTFFQGKEERKIVSEIKTNQEKSEVYVKKLSDIQTEKESIFFYGKLEAKNSIDIYPEISGRVKYIYKKLGDKVLEGQLLLKLDDRDLYANYLQALAMYNKAKYALEKTEKSIKSEDLDIAKNRYEIEKEKEKKFEKDLKRKNQDAPFVLRKILEDYFDHFFDHTDKDPVFVFRIRSEAREKELEAKRKKLSVELKSLEEEISSKNFSLEQKGKKAISVADLFYDFADFLYKKIDDFLGIDELTKKNLKSSILSAKNQSYALSESLSSLIEGKRIQKKAVESALASYKKIKNGVDEEDIKLAESSLLSAQASLTKASLGLEKTTIKSPVSGKISALNVKKGQLVSPSTKLFSISGQSLLRIKAFLEPGFAESLEPGDELLVEDKFKAFVSKKSPSLNPINGKVELEILFKDNPSKKAFPEGSYLKVQAKQKSKEKTLIVPLSALFVKNQNTYLFVVNKNNKLEPKKLEVLDYLSDKVLIKPLWKYKDDDLIVLTARGVKEFQKVSPVIKK